MTSAREAAELLRNARRIVVFTGAGISQESGIDTFRDLGGLWEKYPLEEFATPGGLLTIAFRSPDRLASFLHDVLAPIAHAQPNPAHAAVAALEARAPQVDVITQNIDGLHHDAGSEAVHEVHGSLFAIVDPRGAKLHRLDRDALRAVAARLERSKSGRLVLPRVLRAARPVLGLHPLRGVTHRPNVVLFGEGLAEPDWSNAQRAAAACDVMLVVGTSGLVYPAAALPEAARERGAKIIGVGPEEGDADIWLPGKAGDVLPALVDAAFA